MTVPTTLDVDKDNVRVVCSSTNNIRSTTIFVTQVYWFLLNAAHLKCMLLERKAFVLDRSADATNVEMILILTLSLHLLKSRIIHEMSNAAWRLDLLNNSVVYSVETIGTELYKKIVYGMEWIVVLTHHSRMDLVLFSTTPDRTNRKISHLLAHSGSNPNLPQAPAAAVHTASSKWVPGISWRHLTTAICSVVIYIYTCCKCECRPIFTLFVLT